MSKHPWRSLLVIGLLVGSACGGDDDSGAAAKDTADQTDGSQRSAKDKDKDDAADGTDAAAGPMPDACSLLTGEDLTALTGLQMKALPIEDTKGGAAPVAASYCTWQDGTNFSTLVGLQIYAPGREKGGIDPLAILGGVSQKQIPIDLETDGKLLDDVGLILGGGGIGKSITFKKGEFTVALGMTGDNVDAAKLESLARKVADQI